jgi:pilus assembly protein CpaF
MERPMSQPTAFVPALSLDDIPVATPVLEAHAPPADDPLLESVKRRVHDRLTQELDPTEVQRLSADSRRADLRKVVHRFLDQEGPGLAPEDRARLTDELLDEVLGLGPLEPLLRDPTISDVLVNGPSEVYIERGGKLEETGVRFRDADHLMLVIERIVARVGRRLDDSSPMVDARLADGSRVNAVIPPLALKGPTLSIRRFGRQLALDDLLRYRALTPEMAMLMEAAVVGKLNVVVSGGTGSGKTTLLNALSGFIPAGERVVTIEDAAELRLQQRHVVPLETRPPNSDGKNGVTMRDLMRNALRMRPDRIVVGECRGPEALDMLQAMNTGHEGSLTTVHANTPRDALTRLETMVMMAGFEMPLKALRRQIASAINLIIQAERLTGGPRRVTSMVEVVGMEGDTIVAQELFTFQPQGVGPDGKAFGQFVATGVRPAFAQRLRSAGIDLPPALFQQRVLLRA